MEEEKPQTIEQRENAKRKLLSKLVATARNIISNEVGLPVGVWKIHRLLGWLKNDGVDLDFPIFKDYRMATIETPSGKERLNCSRDALRRYDAELNQTNLRYHDQILDACFTIIETYSTNDSHEL